MLGDTLPWFFPTLAISLCLWLALPSIEKNGGASVRIGTLVRWGPALMFAWLLLHRMSAIVQLDTTHLEVLQYLPQDASLVERGKLLVSGQAGHELAALAVVVFAAASNRLPTIHMLGEGAANTARYRIMSFTALCLLMSLGLFFPESAYTATNPLPEQGILAPLSLSNAVLPLLFALMVMFSGELFAASSTYSIGADFSPLAKKASMKNAVLIAVTLLWLATNPPAWTAWNDDPSSGTDIIALLMALHATVALTFVVRPSRTIESRLLHGERRSLALVAMFGCSALLMMISAGFLLDTTDVFATTAGANLYGFWACTVVLGAMLLAQFMPTLGFDAAPRPEAWWLRSMALFMPMMIMAFSPMNVYILPGVWLALAWTLVLPWLVEADVRSPSTGFVVAPLIGTTIGALLIPLLASHALLPALVLALPALAVALFGMLVHKPSATI